jgi:hypothetical protein
MESVDPLDIIGYTLVDHVGKHPVKILSLIGSGSFAHVYLAEEIMSISTQEDQEETDSESEHTTNNTIPLSPSRLTATESFNDNKNNKHSRYEGRTVPNTGRKLRGSVRVVGTGIKRAVKRLFKNGLDEKQLSLQRCFHCFTF